MANTKKKMGERLTLNPKGGKPLEEAKKTPQPEIPERLNIQIPRADFTDTALENLDKLVASKATLLKKAIGTEALPVAISGDLWQRELGHGLPRLLGHQPRQDRHRVGFPAGKDKAPGPYWVYDENDGCPQFHGLP